MKATCSRFLIFKMRSPYEVAEESKMAAVVRWPPHILKELPEALSPPELKENSMKLMVRALLICVVCSLIVPAALPQKHRAQPTASITGNPRPAAPAPQSKNWKVTDLKVREYDQGTGRLDDVTLGQTLSTSANAPFGPILIIVEITGELDAGSGKSI